MADEIVKRVIIDAEIEGAKEAEKDLAALRQQTDALVAARKNIDKSTDDWRVKDEQLRLQIQKNRKELSGMERDILNTAKANGELGNTLEGLRAKLGTLTAQYNKAELGSKEFYDLQVSVKAVTDELSKAEQASGNFKRQVGDYQGAIERAIGVSGKFGGVINNLISSIITAATTTEANTVATVANTTATTANTGATAAGTAASQAAAAVNGVLATSLKALSVAIGAVTKAALTFIATPVGFVLTAIAVVLGIAIALFSKMMNVIKGNEEQYAKLQQVLAPIRVLVDALTRVFEGLADVFLNVAAAMTPVLTLFTDLIGLTKDAQGETDKFIQLEKDRVQLAKDTRAMNEAAKKAEIETSALRAKIANKEGVSLKERLAAIDRLRTIETALAAEQKRIAEERLRILKLSYDPTKNDAAAEKELSDARMAVSQATIDLNNKERELNKLRSTAIKEQQAEDKKAADEAKRNAEDVQRAREEAAKKREELLKRETDLVRAAETAQLDIMQDGFKKSSAIINNNYSTRITDLRNQLQTIKDLSVAEIQAINSQIESLLIKQQNEQKKSFDDFVKSLFDSLGRTVDEQIADVNKKYDDLRNSLNDLPAPDRVSFTSDSEYAEALNKWEAFQFNKAEYEYRLNQKQTEDIQKLRDAAAQTSARSIEESIKKEFDTEIALARGNEAKKLDILIESLKKQKLEKEKAGLDASKEDIQLTEMLSRKRVIILDTELLKAGQNAKKRYDIQREYLLKEQSLYVDNAQAYLQYEQDLQDLTREYWQERIDLVTSYADEAYNAMSALSGLLAQIESNEMAVYNENLTKKKNALKKQLDAGYISQKQYARRIEELDKETAAKEAELARKRLIREKAAQIFSIIIDTAAGITKAVASSPWTFGLPFSAFVAATGALQAATVLSQQPPKAAKGALIEGRSHAQGGETINAESGESVINKRSTSMFLPLLSAINELGGGVPFSRPGSDGGFAVRQITTDNGVNVSDALVKALQQVSIIATIEDIRREDANYVNVESTGTF